MRRGGGRRRRAPLATILLLAAGASGVAAQSGATAFVNVSVLPMDRERVLEGYTVVVEDGVIQRVAPTDGVSPPAGARVVDGSGLYLMPGLGDMYARLPGPEMSPEQMEDILFLYLANNVTTLRTLPGTPAHLQLKRDIAQRRVLGPTLYVGAPPLDRSNAAEPEQAIERMLAHRSAGYDFQPILSDLPPMVWDSLAEEAHSRGYTFGGLIPDSVGLRRALLSGVSWIDHMDGYLESVVSDAVQARVGRGGNVSPREMLESAVGRKMRAMAAHTRSGDSWVVPTLRLWENNARPMNVDSALSAPPMRYVPRDLREHWIRQKAAQPGSDGETAALQATVRGQILRAVAMSGAGVLVGSGSPEAFLVPGFAMREEMACMEAARLTPYEILVAATRNVAEYARAELREAGNFGKVEEGNRADLLLLRGNPFESLDHLWDQAGVMVAGRWISREEMEGRLAAIANRNEG